MTTGDIGDHVSQVYYTEVSKSLVSAVTEQVGRDQKAWQSRPLDAVYPVMLIDAIVLKVRDGNVGNRPVFHYYRGTMDDRVLFGGYHANYHFPGRIDPSLEQSASHELLAEHFFDIFPQLEGLRFTHRWAGVIDTTSRFTTVFGTALGGRLSYAVGYTGLGVASTRFGDRVAPDLVNGRDTEVTRLAMVRRKPMPFPPEPLRYTAVRATRASLAAEDRSGKRNLWLRGLDLAGIGFDS